MMISYAASGVSSNISDTVYQNVLRGEPHTLQQLTEGTRPWQREAEAQVSEKISAAAQNFIAIKDIFKEEVLPVLHRFENVPLLRDILLAKALARMEARRKPPESPPVIPQIPEIPEIVIEPPPVIEETP